MKSKVLILGINGFTGRHFQMFIKNNNLLGSFDFIGVDLKIEKLIEMEYVQQNIAGYDELSGLILAVKPDYIINLVGILKSNALDTIIEVNASLSGRILDIIVKNKLPVKKVLLIGSAAEYGIPSSLPVDEGHPLRPVNLYGLSKAMQTQYGIFYYQNYGTPINIARTFNIIGMNAPTSLSIGSFINQIKLAKSGDSIKVGNLNTKRDFIDIKDAIKGYWSVILNARPGEIFNVCRGESNDIRAILESMIADSGKDLFIDEDETLKSKSDVPNIYGNNAKITSELGWDCPISVHSSIKGLLI